MRKGSGLVLATALLSVLLSALLSACTGTTSPEPAPVPDGLEHGCPDPTTGLRFPDGDLPPGATSVRLCPGEPQGTTGRMVTPYDALVTDVGSVVEAVNALDEAPADQPCTMDGGFDLVYWFGYPDGDWRAVRLGAYGCGFVQVGADERRLGGGLLAGAFRDALARQRAGTMPPDDQHEATCDWPGSDEEVSSPLSGTPVELRTAVLCRIPRPYRYRATTVPADLIPRINAGLMSAPAVERCPRHEVAFTVEGYTPWGDRHTYLVESCGWVTVTRSGGLAAESAEQHAVDPGLLEELLALPQGPLVDVREQP